MVTSALFSEQRCAAVFAFVKIWFRFLEDKTNYIKARKTRLMQGLCQITALSCRSFFSLVWAQHSVLQASLRRCRIVVSGLTKCCLSRLRVMVLAGRFRLKKKKKMERINRSDETTWERRWQREIQILCSGWYMLTEVFSLQTQCMRLKLSILLEAKTVWSSLLYKNFPREHINSILKRRTEIKSTIQGHTTETFFFSQFREEHEIMSYFIHLYLAIPCISNHLSQISGKLAWWTIHNILLHHSEKFNNCLFLGCSLKLQIAVTERNWAVFRLAGTFQKYHKTCFYVWLRRNLFMLLSQC